jgi:hypothetical protein
VEYYNYSTELPFSNKKVKFKEITTEQQIALSKANLSFPKTKENYFDYNNFVLKTIKECLETPDDFDNINIIDYVLFITKLRIVSIGSSIEFITKTENAEFKTAKTTINLNLFLKNLYYGAVEAIKDNLITENNIEIKLCWPTIKSIKVFQDIIDNDFKVVFDSFQEFIEYIKIGDKKIIFSNFDSIQKNEIFCKISVSLIKKVQELVLENVKKLNQCDLFMVESFKNNTFNLYTLSFIDFIRLFFSYDVKSLYEEIFYMAGENLPPEYVLKLSPAERKVYSSIIVEARKRKENNQNDGVNNMIKSNASKSVQDLALEFGQ